MARACSLFATLLIARVEIALCLVITELAAFLQNDPDFWDYLLTSSKRDFGARLLLVVLLADVLLVVAGLYTCELA